MSPRRPNSILDGMTWHLVAAMAVLAVVLGFVSSVALELTRPLHILMSLGISLLAVAIAGALVVGSLVLVDGELLERGINGLVHLLAPGGFDSRRFQDLADASATVIEPFVWSGGVLRGRVTVGGEIWNAEQDENADGVPETGDRVEVAYRRGLVLVVRPGGERGAGVCPTNP